MLKIKDNVDLKTLEKYGFEKETLSNTYIYKKTISVGIADLSINSMNRIINQRCAYPDIIYDLIVDGLVEKVEDK